MTSSSVPTHTSGNYDKVRTGCSLYCFLSDSTFSWPGFQQVWFNFASVSLDDHMPCVVDACFTAGHVVFAVAACHRSLPQLALDPSYSAAPDQQPSKAQLTRDPLPSLCKHPLVLCIYLSHTFFISPITPLNVVSVAFLCFTQSLPNPPPGVLLSADFHRGRPPWWLALNKNKPRVEGQKE